VEWLGVTGGEMGVRGGSKWGGHGGGGRVMGNGKGGGEGERGADGGEQGVG